MDEATDDGIEEAGSDHQTTPARRANPRATIWVSLVLALLLVGAAVFAAVQYRDHRRQVAADQARADALNVAEQFAGRMDTFDGTKLDEYQKQVNALLTTRAKGEFKQSFPAFEQVYKAGKAIGTGTVLAAGVENVDQDSATVLVIHNRLVKSSYGNQQQYLRWAVSLDKVGGKWLVDKFEDGS